MNNDIKNIIEKNIHDLLKLKGAVVIGIDGRCASGKTTYAEKLAGMFNADIIHMDDFFLPLMLRTNERLSQPGENIHYERFLEEAATGIAEKKPFSYRIFDCGLMDFNGERNINPFPVIIVEGAYSMRPELINLYDIKIFIDAPIEERLKRIRNRNGEEMIQSFLNRWIPMEEKYIDELFIKEKCDYILI